MAKTYTINPTSMNGGRRDSISTYWNNFQEGTGGGLIVGHSSSGYSSTYYRAVNVLFSSSDLAQFSGKTITAIKLRITISSGTLGSSNYPYRIRYKYNDVATTPKSSEAWASGNAGSTDFDDTDLDTWSNGQSSGVTTITAGSTHDFNLGTTLPKYGYVIAGNTGNAYMKLATTCQLLVTTTETDYTLSLVYNANGGTNAPATQTQVVTTTGSPSYTFTVSSSQPSRTGYAFVKWNTQANGSGTDKTGGQTITVTGTTTLYAQWNALKSTLNTISAGTIGSNLSVSWTAKGSFQHQISFTLGSSTTSPATVSAGTNSYTFAIPSSWLNQLPTTTSGTATATLQTLVDGVVIGTDSKTFTVNVASSVVPSIGTVTATKVNTNPTVEGWNIYLQSFSQVQITANTLTAGTGASLVSIKFSGQNMDTTLSVSGTSANATSNTITASGSLTYTVLLTDSRGRTASKTVSISVTAYSPPTVTSFNGWRCDADGTVNPITGESLKAEVVYTFTAVGNNAVTNTLSYKKTTEQNYTTAGSNIASGAMTIFATNSADVASTYNVQFTITDSLMNSSTLNITISSVVGIAFGLKNDRARFGGAVRQKGLEVDWNAQFDGVVDVINRRCYATLSSKGWHRVLTIRNTAGYLAYGTLIKFCIIQYGDSGRPSSNHEITLSIASNGARFYGESSNGTTTNVTQIRCTRTTGYQYVDIYVDDSVAHSIDVYFQPYLYEPYQERVTADSLQSVADAPSDEILATYTFVTNATSGIKVYIDPNPASYTIGSNHYASVSYPTGLNGDRVLSIGMQSWSSVSGSVSVMPYGDSSGTWYIIGDAGVTLTNVRFKYWYI